MINLGHDRNKITENMVVNFAITMVYSDVYKTTI